MTSEDENNTSKSLGAFAVGVDEGVVVQVVKLEVAAVDCAGHFLQMPHHVYVEIALQIEHPLGRP